MELYFIRNTQRSFPARQHGSSLSLSLSSPRFRLIAISLSFTYTNSNTHFTEVFIKRQAIRHLVDNRLPVMMIGRHLSSSSIPIKEIPISVDLFGASDSSAQKFLSLLLPSPWSIVANQKPLMIRHYRWYGYWNGCLTTVSRVCSIPLLISILPVILFSILDIHVTVVAYKGIFQRERIRFEQKNAGKICKRT